MTRSAGSGSRAPNITRQSVRYPAQSHGREEAAVLGHQPCGSLSSIWGFSWVHRFYPQVVNQCPPAPAGIVSRGVEATLPLREADSSQVLISITSEGCGLSRSTYPHLPRASFRAEVLNSHLVSAALRPSKPQPNHGGVVQRRRRLQRFDSMV
jgi:hypothetical protein